MPLYVKVISPKVWVYGDYTDSATYDLELKICSDPQMTTPVDLTTFTTITLRMIDPITGEALLHSVYGLTGDATGNLSWKPNSSNAPYFSGGATVRVWLEKTGTKMTAVGVNGSDEILFKNN